MCGIAGIISHEQAPDSPLGTVARMADAQAHRGPDGRGTTLVREHTPTVAFGHRRLAIIDLSPAGAQPMADPHHGLTITFNGEIYNFRELRQQLTDLGHSFHTQTDTEVILKGYAQWGSSCPARLRGMFAFALWDAPRGRLLMARDPLGIKPLYFHWDPTAGRLLFASEVRAILASGLHPPRLDPAGLHSYLRYGSLQEPQTIIAGIRSLPPGGRLVWEPAAAAEPHIDHFWQPEIPPAAPNGRRHPPTTEALHTLLADAVQSQLVADVPVGAFLSGGIDSAAIVALMKEAQADVRTFSIIFDEADFDERQFAREAAEHIGAIHTELRLTGSTVRDELDAALAAFDQPSIDGLNSYYVSRLTRQAGITVALSGVGGDELFGGYSGYARALQLEELAGRLALLPAGLRRAAGAALAPLAATERWRRLSDLLASGEHPYFLSRQLFNPRQITRLLAADQLPRPLPAGEWPGRFALLAARTAAGDPINRASVLELQTYMLSTLLRDTDQMSMAHALEVRVPLIDHLLVEAILAVPGRYKLDPQTPKPLLTNTLAAALPRSITHRPKKGFTFPFEIWLRDMMQNRLRAVLEGGEGLHPLFAPAGTRALWTQFTAGRVSWSRVWAIFMLNHWLHTQQVTI